MRFNNILFPITILCIIIIVICKSSSDQYNEHYDNNNNNNDDNNKNDNDNNNDKYGGSNERDRNRVMLTQGMRKTPDFGEFITFPKYDDIVRYSGSGCYQNAPSDEVRHVKATNTRIPICKGRVNTGRVNSIDLTVIGANGDTSNHIANFYVPITYMDGNEGLKGSNYVMIDYDGPSDIDQIGSIPTNDYKGLPVPYGSKLNPVEHINT